MGSERASFRWCTLTRMDHDGGGFGCEHWGGIHNGVCPTEGCLCAFGHPGRHETEGRYVCEHCGVSCREHTGDSGCEPCGPSCPRAEVQGALTVARVCAATGLSEAELRAALTRKR